MQLCMNLGEVILAKKWVTGVDDREDYLKVLGTEKVTKLKAKSLIQGAVNYGY